MQLYCLDLQYIQHIFLQLQAITLKSMDNFVAILEVSLQILELQTILWLEI